MPFDGEQQWVRLLTEPGSFTVRYHRYYSPSFPSSGPREYWRRKVAGVRVSSLSGGNAFPAGRSLELTIAFWWPLGLFVVLTMILVYTAHPLRRRRWQREGRCLSCGYDLTGNVSGVCPECGKGVPRELRDSEEVEG